MKNILKSMLCIVLCGAILFSLAGCSSVKMTEGNVTKTVETVETALKDFDQKKLEKYVSSTTLSMIFQFADGHEQFTKLGKSIFANMEMEIESIDLDNKTVTIKVSNRDLSKVAGDFTESLLNSLSKLQLLTKLGDDVFLDDSLDMLTSQIDEVDTDVSATVTLKIREGKKNLVLVFDDEGENAVSGGALGAINALVK